MMFRRSRELHALMEQYAPRRTPDFAGLDDLIAMKQAAGRPKDLQGLQVLLKLRERSSTRMPEHQHRGTRNT
jgi:hypothetical protein